VAKESKQTEMKFEEAFQRLQEIVDSLEEGGLSLDELEARFEEGLRLSQFCNQKLDGIEQRVRKLVENAGGELETEPFDEDEAGDKEPT
jgi:exodeoxyribonuclease VII small subunit